MCGGFNLQSQHLQASEQLFHRKLGFCLRRTSGHGCDDRRRACRSGRRGRFWRAGLAVPALVRTVALQVAQQDFACGGVLLTDKPQPEQKAAECLFQLCWADWQAGL